MGNTAEQRGARERTFRVQTSPGKVENLTESQIPKMFDLLPLFEDFQKLVEEKGLPTAKELMKALIVKQIKTLIQEGVRQPFSPADLYEVHKVSDNLIELIDPDYPIAPNIIERSRRFKDHEIMKGVHHVFTDRYELEYQQIKQLVEALSQDTLLTLATVDLLSQQTSEKQVEIHGQIQPAVVSQWYALEMPATDVHPGNEGFFNVYRLVKTQDQNIYVQTQGYLHKLSTKRAVKRLLFKDQKTDHLPQTEQEIMSVITKLDAKRNRFSSDELLIRMGIQAGDLLLPLRIFFARRRQHQQEQPIIRTAKAIIEVLEQELDPALDPHTRKQRLSHVFEAFAHPLMTRREVAPEESVRQYEKILKKGGNRDAFIRAMAPSIPGILKAFPGWTACGFLSVGGSAGQALSPGQAQLAAHSFGGLEKSEVCLPRRCGGCGNTNIPDNATVCPKCFWAPGMKHGYTPRFDQASPNQHQQPLSTSSVHLPSKNNRAGNGETVGAGYFFQRLI